MIKFTPEEINGFYEELMSIIDETFDGERKEKLKEMYEFFGDRILAPASGKAHFHLPVVGGYLRHILNVIQVSEKVAKLYGFIGGNCNFTDEERIFAAMHHDLGKLGDLDHEYYEPESSDWHRKNQGSLFKLNPELTYMNVTDRTFWLLQHFGIKISVNEQFGIMLADGMFNKGKQSYFEAYQPHFQIKNNLAHIIHWSDWMSTIMERDRWRQGEIDNRKELMQKMSEVKETLKEPQTKEEKAFANTNVEVFNDLFNKK